MIRKRPPPCQCDRLDFPHRRDEACDTLEEQDDALHGYDAGDEARYMQICWNNDRG